MAKTIEIKHVNKGYMLGEEKVPVLRDINFEVEEAMNKLSAFLEENL